jgi:hypothetical protein
MRRFVFMVLLVWPFLLPPGICAHSLDLGDWFGDESSNPPADSHDEDHHGDCAGVQKAFLSRTTPDAADARIANVAPLVFSPPSFLSESVPAEREIEPFPGGGPVYILVCALLI